MIKMITKSLITKLQQVLVTHKIESKFLSVHTSSSMIWLLLGFQLLLSFSHVCPPAILSYLQFPKHTMLFSCLHLFPHTLPLLHMGYLLLLICLVNFSFVDSASKLPLQRHTLISLGKTRCFFPCIYIVLMVLSLSLYYMMHLPDKWISNFKVPKTHKWNFQKSKLWSYHQKFWSSRSGWSVRASILMKSPDASVPSLF